MRLYYMITTIDPVIMGQSNATSSNVECFDFIPGSVVLGTVAAKHYRDLSEDESWKLFHNGECRFSNCYPLVTDDCKAASALPIPKSWFAEKNTDIEQTQTVTNRASARFSYEAAKHHKQTHFFKSLDSVFISDAGKAAIVQKNMTGKTAINDNTKTAKSGHLFNYAYIEAGQSFVGWIDCENQQLFTLLQKAMSRSHRIGRSRNAEFGRVQFELLPGEYTPAKPVNHPDRLVLWCLSDVELYDGNGMPTLRPQGADIHPALFDATLSIEHSFVSPVSTSRFNQKRQGEDSEQLMLAMGSVLVFNLNEQLPYEVLLALQVDGIGANRQQGLGWVYVNPPWSEYETVNFNERPLFDGIELSGPAKPKVQIATAEDSGLIAWIEEKVTAQNAGTELQKQVLAALKDILNQYETARRYNNIGVKNAAGPSASQWSRLFALVRSQALCSQDSWTDAAFKGESAICKAKNDPLGWGLDWHDDSGYLTFADAIKASLEDKDTTFMRALLEVMSPYDLSDHGQIQKCRNEQLLEAVK